MNTETSDEIDSSHSKIRLVQRERTLLSWIRSHIVGRMPVLER